MQHYSTQAATLLVTLSEILRLMFYSLEVVISPPALYLLLTRQHLRKDVEVAAQNVFHKPNGAFTGEISVEQLKDSDVKWTILGHSERRVVMQEDDKVIFFFLRSFM